MTKLAEEFASLFAGLERSSGRYVVPDGARPDAKGKVLGRAWSSHEPVTIERWEDHLSGRKVTVKNEETGEPITGSLGLGIVPIREDSMCIFGAIDVDQYDPPIDFKVFLARVAALKIPVIVCRSKSGAPHVYLFLSAPTPAELVRERLSEWAVALNHPGVEVFPKQSLLSQYSDGSWINVPYSGGRRSVRYALKPDGSAMTPEEFVAAARAAAISPADLLEFELPAEEESSELFPEGPPCLQTLARVGFGDWQNNGLFNVAIYLRLKHGDGWEEHLADYNERLMQPPLSVAGVNAIIKSVKKKAYFYKCKDQPIAPVCNRSVCLRRACGIGRDRDDPGIEIGEMTKVQTDPVLWVVPVNGKDLELATADLTDQRRFRAATIERISVWPNLVKPDEWQKTIRDRIGRAKVVVVPEDGTREGQFWEHLANFCTSRSRARNLDEILMGKAFTDPKTARAWFRSTDFFTYLAAHRFAISEREGWRFLRHRGAEHTGKNLKGKFVNVWSVPAFPEQTEAHDVPRSPPKEEM